MLSLRPMMAVSTLAALALAASLACGGGGIQKRREPEPVPEPACGDGLITEGEDCDGSDLGPNSCNSLGFDLGTLACSADCTFDTSRCVKLCGDGMIGPGEECDGAVGPLSCGEWGYKACTDQCRVSGLNCRATAYTALPPLSRASGGAAILTDLSPERFGDVVVASAAFRRLETFDYDLTQGFPSSPDRTISNAAARTPVLPIAADLDADGHRDLASINEDGSVDRYRFVPGGSFLFEALSAPGLTDAGMAICAASEWVGAGAVDAAAGADLVALGCAVTTQPGAYAILIYPGGAQPGPIVQVTTGAAFLSAALSDVDGDGQLDVLAATDDGKVIAITKSGTEVGAPVALPSAAARLGAGDLDADGDVDLVMISGGEVVVLENASGTYTAKKTETAAAAALIVADLDLDGAVDYAWQEDGKVELRRNLGQFTFTSWPLTTGAGTPLSFSLGDLEGDGDPDLAATARTGTSSTTTWVLQNKVR